MLHNKNTIDETFSASTKIRNEIAIEHQHSNTFSRTGNEKKYNYIYLCFFLFIVLALPIPNHIASKRERNKTINIPLSQSSFLYILFSIHTKFASRPLVANTFKRARNEHNNNTSVTGTVSSLFSTTPAHHSFTVHLD